MLSRGEEALLAFLTAFYRQDGAAPADVKVRMWVEGQSDPVLTQFFEDTELENPVYGADFTTAYTRELDRQRTTAFITATREVVDIKTGASPKPLDAALDHLKMRMGALTGVSVDHAVQRCLQDIQPEPLAWLWPHWFPLGKIGELVGDPDLGKSLITLDITARVSRGAAFPDGAPCI